MYEQIPPASATSPLNRPGQPAAQADPAQTTTDSPAGVFSAQALPGDNQPEAVTPPGEETASRPADNPKRGWSSTPAGSKAADGDDVDQVRRDGRYLAALVSSVPRAAGEDGQTDLALACEIHAAIQPKDILDRWLVEDLFHGRRDMRRYRTQRIELPRALRFKAIVALLMQYKHVYRLEPTKTALDYLGPASPERDQARNRLRRFDITDAAINAQAAELHEKTIASLDRLIAQGQTRCSSLIREVKQHKRRQAKERARHERSKSDRPDQPELALH